MWLFIYPAGEVPIYRQIMRQITEAIAVGKLGPEDKLLSHRELAEQLAIAPLTVKKAYDELETLGFLETQRGRGTFVCARLPRFDSADQREQMKALARKLLTLAYLGGLHFNDALKVLKEARREIAHGRRELQ
jgi:GntR family transcriptional regulator